MTIKITKASIHSWSVQAIKLLAVLLPCYLLILVMGIYLELKRQHTIVSEGNHALEYQFQQQYRQELRLLAVLREAMEPLLATRPIPLSLPEDTLSVAGSLQIADNLLALYLIDSEQRLQPLYRTSAPTGAALPAAVTFGWLPQYIQRYAHSGKGAPIRSLHAGQHNEMLRLKYYPLPQQQQAMLVVQGMASYMDAINALLPQGYQLLLSLEQIKLVIKSFDQQQYTLYDFADAIHIEDRTPFSQRQIAAARGRFLLARSGVYFIDAMTLNAHPIVPDDHNAINLTDQPGPIYHTAIYLIDWPTLLSQWPAQPAYLAGLPLALLLMLLLATRQRYRKRHIQQLEVQQRILEKALDNIFGCIITDHWSRIIHVNRAARELWQLSNPHIELRCARSLFGPSELWLTLLRKARLGDSSPTEACIPQADGSIRELQIQVSGLFLGRRKFDGMVLCMQDVTEQKRRQQQLQISATAFHTHEMVAVTDAATNIIDVNASFCKETGFSKEELIGRSLFSLFSKYHSEDYLRFVKRTLALHGYWEGEVFTQRKHGLHLCELRTITAIFDSNGNLSHYVSTGNNISQRRHHEQQVEP